MLAAAVAALVRELRGLDAAALGAHIRSYGPGLLAIGLTACVASFLVLGIVELIAVRGWAHIRVLSPTLIVATSFVANAMSQSIGLSVVTGAAVRERTYSRHGVDGGGVARISAFVTVTATLGLLACGGVALLAAPAHLASGRMSIATTPLGVGLLVVVAAYVAWSAFGRSTHVGKGRWRVERPSFATASAQVVLSMLDWVLAATVLFAFVPASLSFSYGAIVSAYIIAQLLAVTSHVPAGAGVFEVAILSLLAHDASVPMRAGIAAALVMFRIVYYLLPLIAAVLVALIAEVRLRRVTSDTRVASAPLVHHAG